MPPWDCERPRTGASRYGLGHVLCKQAHPSNQKPAINNGLSCHAKNQVGFVARISAVTRTVGGLPENHRRQDGETIFSILSKIFCYTRINSRGWTMSKSYFEAEPIYPH